MKSRKDIDNPGERSAYVVSECCHSNFSVVEIGKFHAAKCLSCHKICRTVREQNDTKEES